MPLLPPSLIFQDLEVSSENSLGWSAYLRWAILSSRVKETAFPSKCPLPTVGIDCLLQAS